MSRKTRPGLPDVDVVHEVIRLGDALLAAERRSTSTDVLRWFQLPERIALFDYLSRLPDVRMAELHAVFWLGNQLSSTARAYESLYQHALNNLDNGASYLSAKPLRDGLRRGLAKLGLSPDRITSRPVGNLQPVTHQED
jgi:hypothetical protein